MQIFDLVERKNETPSKTDFKADLSDFVKRDEITRLEERIAALEAIKRSKGQYGSARLYQIHAGDEGQRPKSDYQQHGQQRADKPAAVKHRPAESKAIQRTV